jgi:hypothetical protein
MFSRSYGWDAARYGSVAGVISLVLSPIGLLAGIRLTEWLYQRGYHDANLRLTAICTWLVLPSIVLMPLMPTAEGAFVMIAWTSLVSVAAIGSESAALLVVTPNQMRGQVTALYLVMFNVIGYGLGPTMVALFTDYVFGSESELHHSMFMAALLLGPLGSLVLTLGVKPYGRAFLRAQQWN